MTPTRRLLTLGILTLLLTSSSAAIATTTTINQTRIISTDSIITGRTALGTMNGQIVDTTTLHVEGSSVFNGSATQTHQINGTGITFGNWTTYLLGNLTNLTLTNYRTWTLPDATGTILLDSTECQCVTWTNANTTFGKLAANNAWTGLGTNTFTGALSAANGYFPNIIANTSITGGTITATTGTFTSAVTGTTLVNTGKVVGSDGYFPNLVVNTSAAFPTNAIAWGAVSKTGSSLADLTTRSAADLSTGTLADARLSSNVPLKDANNAFTAAGTNTYTGSIAAARGYVPVIVSNTSIVIGNDTLPGWGGEILGSVGNFAITRYGASPSFLIGRAQGTATAPTALTSGLNFGTWKFGGYDGSAFFTSGPTFLAQTTEAWTSTAHGAKLVFATTPNGASSSNNAITIDQDGSLLMLQAGAKLGFYGATGVTQPARAGQLTDNSGGTSGGNTIAAINGVTVCTSNSCAGKVETANAIATLAARLNSIETIIHNVGLSA